MKKAILTLVLLLLGLSLGLSQTYKISTTFADTARASFIADSAKVAHSATSAGVSLFNGRAGNVTPAWNDYPFWKIGGFLQDTQLVAGTGITYDKTNGHISGTDTTSLSSRINGKQASGTYLIPSDTTNFRGKSNSLYQAKGTYLIPSDSTTSRTYSNSLYQTKGTYLTPSDSTTSRTYSDSKYVLQTTTVAGNPLSTSVTQDQITGLASTGLVKRTASNTLAIASAGTDYQSPLSGSSAVELKSINLEQSGYGYTNYSLMDTTAGQDTTMFSVQWKAQRWGLYAGTFASPLTVAGPTVKIVRYQNFDSTAVSNKADLGANSALYVLNNATVNNYPQPIGITGAAQTYSKRSYTTGNDAAGGAFYGRAYGSATGIGIGMFSDGRRDTAYAKANAAQFSVSDWTNNTNPPYNSTGFDSTCDIWISNHGNSGRIIASGIKFGNGDGIPMNVGIGFANQNGGAVTQSDFRTDDTSMTSVLIGGTHRTGSLIVGQNAGDVGIGYTTPPIVASAGRQFVTVVGNTDAGVVEFGTRAADADGAQLGLVQASDINSTLSSKRRAAIRFLLSGNTADQRGGAIRFDIGKNGVSDCSQVEKIDSLGYHIFGSSSNPSYPIDMRGTSTAQTMMYVNQTNNSSNTSQLNGLYNNIQFNPAGASLSTIYGDLFTPTISGSSLTITTASAFNATFNSTAGFSGTITNVKLFEAQNPTRSGGTFTSLSGFYANDMTQGGTNNYGYFGGVSSGTGKWNAYMSGTAANYFAGNTSIGSTTTTSQFNVGSAAQFQMNSTGAVTQYNNIATVGGGIPAQVATVALTAQTAAVNTTTLYAVPAAGAGQYRISWNAKVTTAATSSSTLGALTIVYTDPDGVAQTITAPATIAAGTLATTSAGNSTTTVLLGMPLLLNCKASTNVTYAFAYASSGGTPMAYNLNVRLEDLR